MNKVMLVAVTVLLSGAVMVSNQSASAQPGEPPTSSPGKMIGTQTEKRLMRMSRTLDLTEEQKAKIKPILEDEAARIKAIHEDSSLTQQQRRDKIREIHAAGYEQMKPFLTQEQQKKHEEMVKSAGEWHKGMHAVSPASRLERMSQTLNLTEEQKTKIKPILEDEAAKIKAVHDDSTLTRQQMGDKVREIHAATYGKIKPLLTPEQLKKHEEMSERWKGMPGQGAGSGRP